MVDVVTRRSVRQRAGNRCEYCRLPEELSDVPFHVEHIVARQHQGGDELANLALACDRCNLYKGPNLAAREGGRTVDLFHPRRHVWEEYFEFSGAKIIGISPTGRATVRLLNMNAPRRVAIRQRMLDRGESL
ncbi:MAG: HNH endonuclease signature motif containing protein [Planctomycetota bacterium]|nr:HNH endonuclease signature motif containing protein [Planctomycetota bacterium]